VERASLGCDLNDPNHGARKDEHSAPADPAELQRQLQTSPGYRANALIATVNRYSYILQGNIAQYLSLVNAIQDPSYAIPLLAEQDLQRHDAMLSESERLLHNVVLALKTRIDLLRVFMDKYFADDLVLANAYKAQIGDLFGTDSARFLEGLRNHMTHHLLPVSRSLFSISAAGSMTFTVILDAQALLEWEWSAPVRQWIEGQSSNVMIAEVVKEYGNLAKQFDDWLVKTIAEKYQQELSAFQTAIEEYRRRFAYILGG
jgi:hypothetical protein